MYIYIYIYIYIEREREREFFRARKQLYDDYYVNDSINLFYLGSGSFKKNDPALLA